MCKNLLLWFIESNAAGMSIPVIWTLSPCVTLHFTQNCKRIDVTCIASNTVSCVRLLCLRFKFYDLPRDGAYAYTYMRTYIHTYIHTYIFVVNFDALAEASDFRIERRQIVFLCRMQDSNPGGLWNPIFSRLNTCWQTDWAIEDQAKTWTRQPVPMITYIHTCLLLSISMLWHRQAIFKSKGDKLSSSAECRIWTRDPRHQFASRRNARWQTDWAIEVQAKNLNSTARPYDQRAFSPLGPTVSWLSHLALAIYMYIHTYINTYIHTYLLLISMLWPRQAIFESKGEKFSFSAESRIRPQRFPDTYSPADWMPADKPTELSRIKLKLELDSLSLWSASIQPTWPHCHLAFAPGSGDIHICCC